MSSSSKYLIVTAAVLVLRFSSLPRLMIVTEAVKAVAAGHWHSCKHANQWSAGTPLSACESAVEAVCLCEHAHQFSVGTPACTSVPEEVQSSSAARWSFASLQVALLPTVRSPDTYRQVHNTQFVASCCAVLNVLQIRLMELRCKQARFLISGPQQAASQHGRTVATVGVTHQWPLTAQVGALSALPCCARS